MGHLWQGPVNGKGATEQYFYCNSAPHQLTGIYPTGTTCANKGSATAVYSAGYDAWGNETSRTYNSVTSTLSYDALNRMTEYNAGSAGQEFYVYDASGNRVLKRTISGGTTKLTAYAFGLQELSYTGNGAYSSQTDYYSIAGHLIGSTNGTTTTYDLTDAEGSVLTTLSSSAVLGEQIYGPYGNQRYTQGTMGTDKGYTGQFQDAATGLDYYNARYYDPVMGQFLSADNVQGNAQGFDPYSYVNGNPEMATDPTGQRISCPPDCGTPTSGSSNAPCTINAAGCSGHPVAPSSGGHEESGGKVGAPKGQGGHVGCQSNCGGSGSTTPLGYHSGQGTNTSACNASCTQQEEHRAQDADSQLNGIITNLQNLQFWLSRVINWFAGFLGSVAGIVFGLAIAGATGIALGLVGPYLYATFTDAASDIGDLITDAQTVQSQFKSEENKNFWSGSATELYQGLQSVGNSINGTISNYDQKFNTLKKVGMALTLVGFPVAPVGSAIMANANGALIENQQISTIANNAIAEEELNCNCIGGV